MVQYRDGFKLFVLLNELRYCLVPFWFCNSTCVSVFFALRREKAKKYVPAEGPLKTPGSCAYGIAHSRHDHIKWNRGSVRV